MKRWRDERDSIPLVLSGDDIVWVAVTGQTTGFACPQYKKVSETCYSKGEILVSGVILTEEIRVRFAPSPTGFSISEGKDSTFNWLYARNMKGTFVLRIEDTDEPVPR